MERRQHARQSINVAISIGAARGERVGMSRDISATGIVFGSVSEFAVGERLRLKFRTGKGEYDHAEGRVVRIGRDLDRYMFHNVTAVAFERPVPSLAS
jgi:hypothetical protein